MKQKTIILLILLSISIIACKKEKKTTIKENKTTTTLTLTSKDSINLKLTKVYDIGMMKLQEVEVELAENKNFIVEEKLDKLLLCYAIAANGSSAFFIDPNIKRSIEIKTNDAGNLEFVFEKEDFVNNFTKTFHKKLNSLFSFEGNENDFLDTINKSELESLNQLNEIKTKIDNNSYSTLKGMVTGKMAHLKFIFSKRFKSLTPQSSYYNFTDNLNLDNDNYLIYSDNLNTLYSTLEIQHERKYNSSFADAPNKLKFINEFIKNDELRSQFISFFLSKEIPEKTEKEKQEILDGLKKMNINEQYYTYISNIEAGSALGTKTGNQAKYLETLISKNKDFNIESLNGKTLYIDNWAIWCGPCVKSMKNFLSKYNELKKVKGVTFVFVSFDRNESIWRKYLKENNFPEENVVHLYNGSDMKSTYGKYYNIVGLPRYFVTNKTGMISNLNPSTPSDEDFEEFIKKIAD